MSSINILATEKNGFKKLSNLCTPPVQFQWEDKVQSFKTVEHAYQFAKAVHLGRYGIAELILHSSNAWEAKCLGSELANMETGKNRSISSCVQKW